MSILQRTILRHASYQKRNSKQAAGWVHLATSNLAIQALMAAGIDVMPK
ncbi:MAG: hypothetical protein KAH86_07980 [Methanosarcinales archaeon]|nr:hypothetical protein [Methanosarcinales archaeon]